MANSIALNSEMSKLLFTTSSGTTEIDLSGNGVLLKTSGGDIGAEAAVSPLSGSGIVEATTNAQWTVIYNDSTKLVFFIGIEEIDTSITTTSHHFSLEEAKVNIRKVGSSLIIVSE